MNNCNISGPENEFQLHAASQHITWMFLVFMYVLLKQSKGTPPCFWLYSGQRSVLHAEPAADTEKQKEQKKSF